MFVNILFFAFLSAFTAIVALGHVLLITAIWPELFKIRRDQLETVSGGNQRLHQPH